MPASSRAFLTLLRRALSELVYTRKVVKFRWRFFGKLVKVQRGPATVSAEDRPSKPLFRRRDGKAGRIR